MSSALGRDVCCSTCHLPKESSGGVPGAITAEYVGIVSIGWSGGGWADMSFVPEIRLFRLARNFAGTTLLRMLVARSLAPPPNEPSFFGDRGGSVSDEGPDEKASASIAGDVGDP